MTEIIKSDDKYKYILLVLILTTIQQKTERITSTNHFF